MLKSLSLSFALFTGFTSAFAGTIQPAPQIQMLISCAPEFKKLDSITFTVTAVGERNTPAIGGSLYLNKVTGQPSGFQRVDISAYSSFATDKNEASFKADLGRNGYAQITLDKRFNKSTIDISIFANPPISSGGRSTSYKCQMDEAGIINFLNGGIRK